MSTKKLHLRLPPLAILDLIFHLAYRVEKSRLNAYSLTSVLAMFLAAGLLLTLSAAFQVDLAEVLQRAYAIDMLDIPQSPMRREAGPAVLFGAPIVVLFFVSFYRRSQIDRINDWYSALAMSQSFLPGYVLFLVSSAGVALVGAFSPKLLSFPLQITYLTLLCFLTSVPGVFLPRGEGEG